jgi:predicted metal-dependent hydrolase
MLRRLATLLNPAPVRPPARRAALPPALPQLSSIEVVHEGQVFPVTVKPSARARRYTLRVVPATREAVLTMPARGRLATAKDFALRHGGWLAARYARLPAVVPLAAGAIVPLRGVPHRIEQGAAARGTVQVVAAPPGDMPRLVVCGAPEHLPRRVRDFLRREAQRDLQAAVTHHATALGVGIAAVRIKDTRSRWGSCSAAGVLSFSWRLILAPPHVLWYLAAHEVAHRREMNHSPRYWAIVRQLDPDFERAEAWLKRHGQELHGYIV